MKNMLAVLAFVLVLPAISTLSAEDRALVEQFYLSRTGDDLQWNKADKAAQVIKGKWHTAFLTKNAQVKLVKSAQSPVRCSAYPPYDLGLNACKKQPHSTGDCFLTLGAKVSYTCECQPGWQGGNCTIAYLPCVNVTLYCDKYADCLTTTDPNQMPICACKAGYTTDWDAVNKGKALQCNQDVNECIDDLPCENKGVCTNTVGSYTCTCTEQWAGPNCEFIKRCTDQSTNKYCGTNAKCVDGVTTGSVYGTCKCNMGMTGNPYTGCGLRNWLTATAIGDPHITTFDRGNSMATIDYMGTVPFTFARPNWNHEDKPFVPYFKVVVKSSHGCVRNPKVSCIDQVYVDIRDSTNQHRIHFSGNYLSKFDVNGQEHWAPYTELQPLFSVTAQDRENFWLNTNFGFKVQVEKKGSYLNLYVSVQVGSMYDGSMYGLAGNMNRNPADDWTNGDLFTYENNNQGYDGTGGQLQSDLKPFEQSDADWAKANSKCQFLVKEGSPFDLCRQFLNESVMHQAFENCAVDVGSMRNSPHFDDDTCELRLQPVAHQCRNAAYKQLGVDTWTWRNQTGCPAKPCKYDHSFFNENSPMCLNSCTEPNAQALCQTQELQETCMCEQSDSIKYVLSVSGRERCVRWPGGCPRPHKGITMELVEESVDLHCNQNCLFVSQEANIVCKPMVCQPNSQCTVKDAVRDCICDEGHIGDGRVECRVPQRDCADLQKYFGVQQSGVSEIGIWGPIGEQIALCDMTTERGGWTTVQKRVGIATGFDRPWTDYVKGFGTSFSTDFWYGLEAMHIMTNYSAMGVSLRIELTDCNDQLLFQEYDNVKLGPAADNYRLYFGKSHGTAGDALQSLDPDSNSANGMQFSTADRDNDVMAGLNCAQLYSGGWWFRQCSTSNLNGKFYAACGGQNQLDTLQWLSDPQQLPHSYKLVEMKMRPSVYPPTD